jgi:hypothetical protein
MAGAVPLFLFIGYRDGYEVGSLDFRGKIKYYMKYVNKKPLTGLKWHEIEK